jgi:putative addiction module component (TIGR02574 family)
VSSYTGFMPAYDIVLREALSLTDEEREALAVQLGDSLPVGDYALDDDVRAEVARRRAMFDAGETQGVPWNVARELIFGD